MPTEYVQKQHNVYRITGTRISFDSLVYAWWAGQSAETIAQSFQVLTLEQVYGAIAFYLAHRKKIDRCQVPSADYEPGGKPHAMRIRCSLRRWQKRAVN